MDRARSRQARMAAIRKKKRKRSIIIGCAALVVIAAVVTLAVVLPSNGKKPAKAGTHALSEKQQSVAATVPQSTSAQPAETSPAVASQPATTPAPVATSPPAPPPAPAAPALVAPMDSKPLYPYTKAESMACGHWGAGSTDYPYFGAPRENSRLHAGVDVYPATGVGTPVKAIKDGKVIKVGLFYTRADGEKTYGVLVDHGGFVANYAELHPSVSAGDTVKQGAVIGTVSGTKQLHFELYTAGTTNWINWYGAQPANLVDPTNTMINLVGN